MNEWGEGENSFAEDPPNAVVSFLEEGDTVPEDVTVELRDPQLTEDTLCAGYLSYPSAQSGL